MSELIVKPEQPGEFECCENGCSACVWDLYYEQLQAWNEQQARLKATEEEGQSDD